MRITERLQRLLEDWVGPFLLFILLFLIGCLGVGCASAKANSQKTLAGIQYAKDAAMKTWGVYVAKEQRRCDLMLEGERQVAHAKLLEKRLEVDAALRKFSAAWMLAWTAANYDTDKPATGQLSEAMSQLQFAVSAFTK